MNLLWIGLALQGCAPDSGGKEAGGDTARTDSGESGDTADTQDTDTAPPDTDGTTGRPRDTVTIELDPEADAKFLFPDIAETRAPLQLGSAGDCTGDGLDDLLFGLPSYPFDSSDGGMAYLVPAPTTGTVRLDEVEVIAVGGWNASYGAAVTGVGDLDANGFDDFLVSASTQYVDEDQQAGEVYLYSGPFIPNGDASTLPTATLKGEWRSSDYVNSSYTGDSVAGLGDYNGDGFGDVAIGAPFYNFSVGAAYVMLGPLTGDHYLASEATLRVTNVGATNVASAGDVNGDGLGDLILGGASATTYAWIFFGGSTGDLDGADGDAVIGTTDGNFGGDVPTGVGDVDGDGYGDILVDAPVDDEGGTDAGAALLFDGPLAGSIRVDDSDARLTGANTRENASADLAPAGDTNADGYADMLIGVSTLDAGTDAAGVAYLILGPCSGHLSLEYADAILKGSDDDEVGSLVAGAGDVDDDGMDDLLIGGPGDDDGGTNAGAAWLVTAATLWAK